MSLIKSITILTLTALTFQISNTRILDGNCQEKLCVSCPGSPKICERCQTDYFAFASECHRCDSNCQICEGIIGCKTCKAGYSSKKFHTGYFVCKSDTIDPFFFYFCGTAAFVFSLILFLLVNNCLIKRVKEDPLEELRAKRNTNESLYESLQGAQIIGDQSTYGETEEIQVEGI